MDGEALLNHDGVQFAKAYLYLFGLPEWQWKEA